MIFFKSKNVVAFQNLGMFLQALTWRGFNLKYGNLKNGKLEAILISKITAMGISKKSNGYQEFSLENGNLEKCVRNQPFQNLGIFLQALNSLSDQCIHSKYWPPKKQNWIKLF